MSAARARREVSKRLALTMGAKYRALVEAVGEDAIQNAAIELGVVFNTNIEFVINVLRDYGGLEAKFEPMTKRTPQIIGVDMAAPGGDRSVIWPTGQDA